ncbi:ankyrin repeat-containing domain protein, partial [Podospora australis]
MAELLLDYGADPNAVGQGTLFTALQSAVCRRNIKLVEFLIKRGADGRAPALRFQDDKTGIWLCGYSALQSAAYAGDVGIAVILIANAADVNASYGEGGTPLECAAKHGSLIIAQVLLSAGVQITGEGHDAYNRAIEKAKANKHFAIAKFLEQN